MDAVGPVDVGEARRPEHHGVARGWAAITVRRRVGVVIGLDLDDHAASAVHHQRRADQVGRDVVDGSVEKGPSDFGANFAGVSQFLIKPCDLDATP